MPNFLSQKSMRYAALGACAVIAVFSVQKFTYKADPVDAELAMQAGFLQNDAVSVAPLADTPPVPEVQRAEVSPALDVLAIPQVPDAPAPMLQAAAEPVPPVSCDPDLKVSAVPGGMAYVALNAPCHIGQTVTLAHAPLSIDMTIPEAGRFAATLPVLDSAQIFAARLQDGASAKAMLPSASASAFDHIVLQWQGPAGFQLHAHEFGAEYGDPGHIWAGNPRETLRGIRGEGGFLHRLGDTETGGVADVYSFPVGKMERAGRVIVTVEVEVTQANCDTDISGQLLQRGADGAVSQTQISFAMPECDAVGDILVLKNLLRDLKVAAK